MSDERERPTYPQIDPSETYPKKKGLLPELLGNSSANNDRSKLLDTGTLISEAVSNDISSAAAIKASEKLIRESTDEIFESVIRILGNTPGLDNLPAISIARMAINLVRSNVDNWKKTLYESNQLENMVEIERSKRKKGQPITLKINKTE